MPRRAVQDFNAGYGGTLSRRVYEVTSHIRDPFEYRPGAVSARSQASGSLASHKRRSHLVAVARFAMGRVESTAQCGRDHSPGRRERHL